MSSGQHQPHVGRDRDYGDGRMTMDLQYTVMNLETDV